MFWEFKSMFCPHYEHVQVPSCIIFFFKNTYETPHPLALMYQLNNEIQIWETSMIKFEKFQLNAKNIDVVIGPTNFIVA